MPETKPAKPKAKATTKTKTTTKRDSSRPSTSGSASGSEDDEEVYAVEKIVGYGYDPDTKEFKLHVKWQGWPDSANTWEPFTNIYDFGGGDIVDQFLEDNDFDKIPLENGDVKLKKVPGLAALRRRERAAAAKARERAQEEPRPPRKGIAKAFARPQRALSTSNDDTDADAKPAGTPAPRPPPPRTGAVQSRMFNFGRPTRPRIRDDSTDSDDEDRAAKRRRRVIRSASDRPSSAKTAAPKPANPLASSKRKSSSTRPASPPAPPTRPPQPSPAAKKQALVRRRRAADKGTHFEISDADDSPAEDPQRTRPPPRPTLASPAKATDPRLLLGTSTPSSQASPQPRPTPIIVLDSDEDEDVARERRRKAKGKGKAVPAVALESASDGALSLGECAASASRSATPPRGVIAAVPPPRPRAARTGSTALAGPSRAVTAAAAAPSSPPPRRRRDFDIQPLPSGHYFGPVHHYRRPQNSPLVGFVRPVPDATLDIYDADGHLELQMTRYNATMAQRSRRLYHAREYQDTGQLFYLEDEDELDFVWRRDGDAMDMDGEEVRKVAAGSGERMGLVVVDVPEMDRLLSWAKTDGEAADAEMTEAPAWTAGEVELPPSLQALFDETAADNTPADDNTPAADRRATPLPETTTGPEGPVYTPGSWLYFPPMLGYSGPPAAPMPATTTTPDAAMETLSIDGTMDTSGTATAETTMTDLPDKDAIPDAVGESAMTPPTPPSAAASEDVSPDATMSDAPTSTPASAVPAEAATAVPADAAMDVAIAAGAAKNEKPTDTTNLADDGMLDDAAMPDAPESASKQLPTAEAAAVEPATPNGTLSGDGADTGTGGAAV